MPHEKLSPAQRRELVLLARRGVALREIARQSRLPLSNVQYWVHRAARQRLDRVDFTDRSRRPDRSPLALSPKMVKRILALRHQLRQHESLSSHTTYDSSPMPTQPIPSDLNVLGLAP